jgi:outer membrane protein assembly factor BamB
MSLNRNFAALFAACMLIALAVPAVAAADYPNNAQFIAYYNSSALVNAAGTTPDNAGYTYVNPAATSKKATTRALTTTLTTPSSTDWPQFHYNAVHNGASPSTGLPSSNSSVWSANINAIGTTNPIISNGKVFVLTGFAGFDEPSDLTTINLTCLDESTGSVLWNFPLPRTVHYGSWSSPATDGTYVYASSDYQHYAIRVSDGVEMWNFTGYNVNVNGGPVIGGNNVYFSDWAGDVYNLDKTSGALNWVFNNSKTTQYDMAYSQSSPAYDATDGSIYVTGYSGSRGYLYKVNSTGYEVWSVQSASGENFCGSPAIDGSTVYVTSYNFSGDGKLYAYNKNTGAVRWNGNFPSIERSDATPAISNGIVYVTGGWNGGDWGSADPGVRAFYATNGTLKWSRVNENMGGWTDSASVADGYVYVGKESGKNELPNYCYNTTYALNATTGATVWSYPQGGATAAIANGKMYTIGNDGYLYRFG